MQAKGSVTITAYKGFISSPFQYKHGLSKASFHLQPLVTSSGDISSLLHFGLHVCSPRFFSPGALCCIASGDMLFSSQYNLLSGYVPFLLKTWPFIYLFKVFVLIKHDNSQVAHIAHRQLLLHSSHADLMVCSDKKPWPNILVDFQHANLWSKSSLCNSLFGSKEYYSSGIYFRSQTFFTEENEGQNMTIL